MNECVRDRLPLRARYRRDGEATCVTRDPFRLCAFPLLLALPPRLLHAMKQTYLLDESIRERRRRWWEGSRDWRKRGSGFKFKQSVCRSPVTMRCFALHCDRPSEDSDAGGDAFGQGTGSDKRDWADVLAPGTGLAKSYNYLDRLTSTCANKYSESSHWGRSRFSFCLKVVIKAYTFFSSFSSNFVGEHPNMSPLLRTLRAVTSAVPRATPERESWQVLPLGHRSVYTHERFLLSSRLWQGSFPLWNDRPFLLGLDGSPVRGPDCAQTETGGPSRAGLPIHLDVGCRQDFAGSLVMYGLFAYLSYRMLLWQLFAELCLSHDCLLRGSHLDSSGQAVLRFVVARNNDTSSSNGNGHGGRSYRRANNRGRNRRRRQQRNCLEQTEPKQWHTNHYNRTICIVYIINHSFFSFSSTSSDTDQKATWRIHM